MSQKKPVILVFNCSHPMKQFEKLDLLLKLLYENRFEGYYPLSEIYLQHGLPIENEAELKRMGKKLQNAGLIDTLCAAEECFALLTQDGIDFCQRDSFSHRGNPLLGKLLA